MNINYEPSLTDELLKSRQSPETLLASIAELEARITEAIAILESEMGEWAAVAPLYLPDHYLQLRQAIDVLEGKESKNGQQI